MASDGKVGGSLSTFRGWSDTTRGSAKIAKSSGQVRIMVSSSSFILLSAMIKTTRLTVGSSTIVDIFELTTLQ